MESYDHELEHSSDIVAAPGPEQEALKAINSISVLLTGEICGG